MFGVYSLSRILSSSSSSPEFMSARYVCRWDSRILSSALGAIVCVMCSFVAAGHTDAHLCNGFESHRAWVVRRHCFADTDDRLYRYAAGCRLILHAQTELHVHTQRMYACKHLENPHYTYACMLSSAFHLRPHTHTPPKFEIQNYRNLQGVVDECGVSLNISLTTYFDT